MINPMQRSGPMRMMGIASGMDTDFIIQQTLRMHQFRIDNQLRNRRLVEWRQETHNSLRDEIEGIRRNWLSTQGPNSVITRNVFNATRATVGGANASAVSIRTNTDSPIGNFTINSVDRIARGAHLNTNTGVSASGEGFANTTRLGDMRFGDDADQITWTHSARTVRIGNEDIRIVRDNNNISSRPDVEGAFTAYRRVNGAWEQLAGHEVIAENGTLTFLTGSGSQPSAIFNIDDSGDLTRLALNTFETTVAVGEDYVRIVWDGNEFSVEAGFTVERVNIAEEGEDPVWAFSVTNDESGYASTFTWDPNATGSGTLTLYSITTPPQTEGGVPNTAIVDEDPPISFGLTQVITNVALVGEMTFEIDGYRPFTFTENTTLGQMLNEINGSNSGVTMRYDRLSDRFTIETRAMGNAAGALDLRDHSSNFLALISGNAPGTAHSVSASQTAVAFINGQRVVSDTNNINFRGVTVTLNHTTRNLDDDRLAEILANPNLTYGAPVDGQHSVSISLERDAQPAIDAIRGFIDVYNSLVARLEGLVNERRTPSQAGHRPLTDEERFHMSDREAEEWERIARIGIMRNDNQIRNLADSLRASFFRQIEGAGLSASQLGLNTGNFFDGTGGQIFIDEDRLRAAIEEDPNRVADAFIGISDDGRGTGLFHQINDQLGRFLAAQRTTTQNLEESIRRANEQIERMQERMWAEEDRLYRQFAAMETAMSRLNSQADWFASMLGA